jgi:alkanesulfonate monooxygenase SsuD/methylene tetrahydromethanopterin reductase-like flavin-dependent oxidoreductase (luciferase family)
MADTASTGGIRPLRFGVVAPLTPDLPTWRERARRIADSGYATLLMPDVPHWQPAPGPTLAVAAALADLRVGTWVYACPLRPAWSIAWEAHSLSVLTDGRFEMGVGTGRPGIEDELRDLGTPKQLFAALTTVALVIASVTLWQPNTPTWLVAVFFFVGRSPWAT